MVRFDAAAGVAQARDASDVAPRGLREARAEVAYLGTPGAVFGLRGIYQEGERRYVTTASDERGRDTVYALLEGAALPWVAPVGRLDKASEGLLLLTNDSAWAARITAPESHLEKTYHVQIDRLPDASLPAALTRGVDEDGERLSARRVSELRRGKKNAWLEIVLDEGRNRQIRRLLAAHGIGVLRLVRVAIGPVALGTLAKGAFRALDAGEMAALAL